MLLRITHETHYRYSAPVEIQPHLLRFHPRNDGSQTTQSFQLHLDPKPVGFTEQLDLEDNLVQFTWFDGAHLELSIKVATTVNTARRNPFDFLKPHSGLSLDQLYHPAEQTRLQRYLMRDQPFCSDDQVRQMACQIAKASGGDPVRFLIDLNQEICNQIELEHRDSGDPFTPQETLGRGRGACRDTAVLFIDACRSTGIAARFASGYHLNEDPDDSNELHGWVEAYLPNAGWRGFDPSVGIAVADEHVTIATASSPRDTFPVTGNYCGQATPTMETQVAVQKLPEADRKFHRPKSFGEKRSLLA
ncbi:MAG: transglutaminase family protein [Planctomycetaceae bacterium]|nr:transglutaminase family protein [Planctomycetaceae bacterium]